MVGGSKSLYVSKWDMVGNGRAVILQIFVLSCVMVTHHERVDSGKAAIVPE